MTQHELILERLSDGFWHSALDLHKYAHTWKAASRISELNAKGIHIESRLVKHPDGKKTAEYKLITPVEHIDFKRCCLKVQPHLLPEADITSKLRRNLLVLTQQAGKDSKCEPSLVSKNSFSPKQAEVGLTGRHPHRQGVTESRAMNRERNVSDEVLDSGSQVSLPQMERAVLPPNTQDSKPPQPAPPLLQMEIAL